MENYKFTFLNCIISYLHLFNINGDVAIFIACQFALESNFGLSDLAVNNHNYCGMKVPSLRISTALNCKTSEVFARYRDLFCCVCDYVLWLCWYKFSIKVFDSLELFKFRLKNSSYCPDVDYIRKINSIYLQFKNHLKNGK